MKSLDSWSDLAPDSPLWVKLGHEIVNFVVLLYSSVTNAFTALQF